jgi:RimJ/RimL family protein N-acetyltransferase
MLVGTAISLRAPAPADLAALTALRNDAELQWGLLGTPHPSTPDMVQAWMAKRLADPLSVFFVIAEQAGDRACGYVMIAEMNLLHGTGELGICLGRAHQGRGYGRESLALVERYVRDVFRLRKVVLRVLASNAPALALYEKTGYETVGTHRAHFYHGGSFHDVTVMEKLLEAAE